jgi:hypothetical protein
MIPSGWFYQWQLVGQGLYVTMLYVNLATSFSSDDRAVIRVSLKVLFGTVQLILLALALHSYCRLKKVYGA